MDHHIPGIPTELTDDLDEADYAVLEAPSDAPILCRCGDLVAYIVIPLNESEATVHPCHCKITPDDLEDLLESNHPGWRDE